MKKLSVVLLFLSLLSGIKAQENKNSIAIIPEPVLLKEKPGRFVLPSSVVIEVPEGQVHETTVLLLKNRLATATGYRVSTSTKAATAAIRLQLNKTANVTLGSEGYQLSVAPQTVTVTANTAAGLFYGAQTLIQLFPKEIESGKTVSGIKWEIPAVEITDYPRFGWRGLMFDVSRHFFTKEQVKEFINQMVRYKYNLLHLHLADDEGWRIEIKGYPNLTKVGAWNVKKVGYFGTFSPPTPDEPRNYGGFFTQDDIRELVHYAKDHFVNILPEIDVPGHSLAAIVSYPELSCTPGAENYVVRSGEPIMDWSRGAPPIALVDNTLCPANEKVYDFLDKVITQLAELFPFDYIHLGGDEAPHNYWQKTDAIKVLMQQQGLKSMEEVQAYFTRRVEKIVASKGKKFIGWDEILEGGGLPKSVAVMSWRGMKNGTEAAKEGHEVVMSPSTYAYLDYMQGDPAIEPRIYASLRLSKAYQFDPLPQGVDPKLIKGGQGNLWAEQLYNMRHVEYMLWPRGWALAESLWSPKERKNWTDFFNRVETHFGRSDAAQIKYAPSVYDPSIKATRAKDTTLRIELSTEVEGLDIYYTFDNSFPDNFYPKYKEPLTPPKDAVQLKMITYRGDKPVGRLLVIPVEELRRRADKGQNYP